MAVIKTKDGVQMQDAESDSQEEVEKCFAFLVKLSWKPFVWRVLSSGSFDQERFVLKLKFLNLLLHLHASLLYTPS